ALAPVGRNPDLQNDAVAGLPPEPPGEPVADDAPGAIGEERLLLLRRQQELRIQAQVALRFDRELGEEILRILVDAAEPVRPRDVADAVDAADRVGMARRPRED